MSSDEREFNICDSCFGRSSNIRMTKIPNGAECKICTFPFDVFQFKSTNRSANVKKSIICFKCSNQRNVCQCCMLDLKWHIPIKVRDKIVSIINNDKSMQTEEAKNDMMKRFLALKDVKLGAAKITDDDVKLEKLMSQLGEYIRKEKALQNQRADDADLKLDNHGRSNAKEFENINIEHVLKKLPLQASFQLKEDVNETERSYFLYNIDQSLPEWKITNKISEILKISDWQEKNSNSVIIKHKSRCGGVRLKNAILASNFVKSIIKDDLILKTKEGLFRGILKIDGHHVFVIPWSMGFSNGSFGNSLKENIKLNIILDKLIRLENNRNDLSTESTTSSGKARIQNKGKIEKKDKNKKSKRITNIQL
ncbi:hypothetical protein TPHA_0M01170 [Tetrapisispora phaffii CBS 4417]|uniref:Pre-mRNA-splicing factor SLT11 n=1 Tax=Tetrapisispora phaffii (strain ATCC 24235 / CBS 4417 / NBRC 1672 / NRRL Y-8282 / UCD 70-5) TaxID=1071381 RepID=G8C0H7_TETPH|nr:hypothetical protein TPHA_0M01170 [Tetrapisispora phaffii CBS 4417]CCE65692.1 hypothetical protein TPHA_0M01170 [Tetrapisispora phaffii CBS 4417]